VNRLVLLYFLLLVAIVGGCTKPAITPATDSKSQVMSGTTSRQAVVASQKMLGMVEFPQSIWKEPCHIPEGGITTRVIKGTCETKAEADGGGWMVSFIQTWDATDFHEVHSPATGGLTHTWQFRVDAQGSVHDPKLFGDFPPQLVK
jgi:hypothetical protein